MGGIGDLLMMEPGLEALAAKQGRPVDFAIPAKFHAIFRNNPHVNLIDIDGPPIELGTYRFWSNLSDCPAGRYESQHRPYIKKGRVEIFAGAMGIKKAALARQGGKISLFPGADAQTFCDDFLKSQGFGKRRLIGVQPYSRDSYKDHVAIIPIIRALAKHNDVLIFHHLSDGLPIGPGIASTAGQSLGHSLALVSRLDAMVSVDSAFLHAAAAFDVPVVALFGPTDGRTFTRHHERVSILWKPQSFGCVPCWRNEDVPCTVTGLLSASPCLSAIAVNEVTEAVDAMLAESGRSGRSVAVPFGSR
jgi:ADP-heptose:LPS heptosyltransferase